MKNQERKRKSNIWYRKWMDLLKTTQGCSRCGTYSGRLVYHHVAENNITKTYVAALSGYSLERWFNEMRDITVLCQSCHRRIHLGLCK